MNSEAGFCIASGRSVPVLGSEGSSPLGHIFVPQTCMR